MTQDSTQSQPKAEEPKAPEDEMTPEQKQALDELKAEQAKIDEQAKKSEEAKNKIEGYCKSIGVKLVPYLYFPQGDPRFGSIPRIMVIPVEEQPQKDEEPQGPSSGEGAPEQRPTPTEAK